MTAWIWATFGHGQRVAVVVAAAFWPTAGLAAATAAFVAGTAANLAAAARARHRAALEAL